MIIYVNHMAGVSIQTLSLLFPYNNSWTAEMTAKTEKKEKGKNDSNAFQFSYLCSVFASCSALKVITREIQIKNSSSRN